MPSTADGVNGSAATTNGRGSPPSGFTMVGSSNTIIPSIKALEEMDEKDLTHQASAVHFVR